VNVSVWKFLAEIMDRCILPEEKMYRGESRVRLKDIGELFELLHEKGFSTDPQVQGQPKAEGGAIDCHYPADSRVWRRWSRSPNYAAIMSSTADDQEVGRPQGGTVMKKNYGGRIVYGAGKPRGDHERLGSAMDYYDVMMVGEVHGASIPDTGAVNFPSDMGKPPADIMVSRIAWSPAVGSTEERQRRLQSLLGSGSGGPLRRRPQPHMPGPPPDDRKADPQHGKFAQFQKRGVGGKDPPLPPEPKDVERFGTAGRSGLGQKISQPKKKKPEED
jgi:hypothetical protein